MQTKRRRAPSGNASVEIADRLRTQILSGSIAAGERLRQDHLAQRFGLSHIPVREALRQLASEGFVTIKPHHGAVVAPLDAGEFAEIMWLRDLIEPALLAAALPHLTSAHLGDARRILEGLDASRSPATWAKLNRSFHLFLYRPADRPQAFAMVERLHLMQERYLRLAATVTDGVGALQLEHYALVDAIEQGRGKEAIALLKQHITVGGDELLSTLSRHGSKFADSVQTRTRARSAARSA